MSATSSQSREKASRRAYRPCSSVSRAARWGADGVTRSTLGIQPAAASSLLRRSSRNSRRSPAGELWSPEGEPLESPIFTPLVNALKERHYTIEVETSGTLPAPRLQIDQWNVSLKLA